MVSAGYRKTEDKLRLFRGCFAGLTQVYGTYDPRTGAVRQVKQPVTDRVILDHLCGRQPYGVYLLVGDRTGALAVDYDEEDLLAPMKFVRAAASQGVEASVERSKSKGYHVWVFFARGGVLAATARRWARCVLRQTGQERVEIFPKQDRLTDGTNYGNFINAPLFGHLVPHGRSVFLDPADHMRPYVDQWGFLARVQRVTEEMLTAAISRMPAVAQKQPTQSAVATPRGDDGNRTFGLPPCARAMLENGVDGDQRVACFRLAVHLKLAGVPHDLAGVLLKAWAARNHPPGNQIIAPSEIDRQVRDAYAKSYRSCGCEDPRIRMHCEPSCPVLRRREETEKPGSPLPAQDGPAGGSEGKS